MNMDTKDPPEALRSPPVNPPPAAPPQLKRGRPRRTLTLEQLDKIVELHPFYGSRKIAKRTNLTRQMVERVLRERGLLATLHTPLLAHSKLQPFYEPIADRVQKDLTATRILREITGMGYSGGRTILAEHLRKLRAEMTVLPRKPTTKRRFETGPAVEMQIDWSPYEILIAGRPVKVHVLGCLLCYSRKLFLHFYRDERQSTLLEGLASAFEYFDGVAHRLVLDNMSTAVLGRIGSGRKPLWHDRFADFVRHYGMDAFACKVRDPDRKGKKEKSFRLVWDDFVKGTEFASWDDLHARCRRWLDETPTLGNLRVHGTTRRVPNEVWDSEEHALLIRLPRDRFPVHESAPRIVDRDSTLSIHGTRYTVPAALAGRSVAVRLFAEHFDVLDPHGCVAFSRIYVPDEQKGRLVIDETHYANLPRRGFWSGPGRRWRPPRRGLPTSLSRPRSFGRWPQVPHEDPRAHPHPRPAAFVRPLRRRRFSCRRHQGPALSPFRCHRRRTHPRPAGRAAARHRRCLATFRMRSHHPWRDRGALSRRICRPRRPAWPPRSEPRERHLVSRAP